MALTLANIENHSLGSLSAVSFQATFDNSYDSGGESLTPADVGLGEFLFVNPIQGEDGYVFKWDASANKLLAYRGADPAGTISTPTFTGTAKVPFFVEEEAVTVTTDVGTLAFVPCYIASIADSTGVTYAIIPAGQTPVDNVSVAVNWTTGVLTFAGADDPAAVRVTYFPSRAGTFFDNANVTTENLTGTDGTGYVDATNRAAAVQYIYDITGTQRLPLSPVGEAPADNFVELDINRSSATSIKNHAGEDGSTIEIRYLNFSALTPGISFVDQADVSLTTGDKDFSGVAGMSGDELLHIPGFGTEVVGEETGAGNENAIWGDSGTTEANNVARLATKINLWATANTNAFVTTAVSYLTIDLNQLVPADPVGAVSTPTLTGGGAVPLSEVAAAVNLSAVVLKVFVIGR